MTHVICYHAFKPLYESSLISEGIAVYFDQRRNNRMDEAKASLNGNSVTIRDLWNHQISENILYPVGGAFIDYLIENGSTDQLKGLLKDQSYENFKKIYPNALELEKNFEKKLTSGNELSDSAIQKTVVFNTVQEYPVIKLDLKKMLDPRNKPDFTKVNPNDIYQEIKIKPTLGVIIDASEYFKSTDAPNMENLRVNFVIENMSFNVNFDKSFTFIADKRNLKPIMPNSKNFLGFWGNGVYTLYLNITDSSDKDHPKIKLSMLKLILEE